LDSVSFNNDESEKSVMIEHLSAIASHDINQRKPLICVCNKLSESNAKSFESITADLKVVLGEEMAERWRFIASPHAGNDPTAFESARKFEFVVFVFVSFV
jgi:hypothetical protein